MEIKFTKVYLYKNYNSSIETKLLSNLDFFLPENKISAISGSPEKTMIGKLICALEKPSVGSVKIGKYVIERGIYIRNINGLRSNIGYLYSDPKDFLFNKTVQKEIEFGLKHYKYKLNVLKKRVLDALLLVGLDETYLQKSPQELSSTEQKKVMLASVLACNPKVIVFDEFEKSFNNIERRNLIRLIKMLKTKYKKTIIMISNDTNFLINFVDYYYFVKNGTIAYQCTKDELYNKGIDKYIDVPEIIKFINLAREKGAKLSNYYELNELIKGVYRDVK